MRWCKYLLILMVASSSLCLSSGMLELSLLPFYTSPENLFSPSRSYLGSITGESEKLFSWFSSAHSSCLPVPEDSKNVLVIIDDDRPGHHQVIMLLPVNKEKLISTFVLDDDTDTDVIPLPCDQDACIARDYNGHVSVPDLSETVPEPGTFETKAGRAREVIRTMGQNGDIIYQWYDQDGHLHTLSEWEFRRRLSVYFQSLLEFLYPEFFGFALPAGGGWHRWQYRNARKASDRPGKSGQSLWRGQGRGEQGRGQQWHSQRRKEGTKPVAVVKPVRAGHTEPQPNRQQRHHYRRNEPFSTDEKGSIDALLTEFEAGGLQRRASQFGQQYDGRNHSFFCSQIKGLTQARKAPLDNEEKHCFEPFMKHLSRVVYSFNSKSLSTCVHSLTVSGLLDRPSLHSVRTSQQHLLEKLLDAIQLQARRPGEQTTFDAWAVSNQLWALAKLVERKVITPEQASPAVTALLPQVQHHQAEFNPQAVANQLWALAKLVEREVLTAKQASQAITALLPQVLKHQAEFNPQAVANQLWALAKLVEREVLTPKQANPAVTALSPQVQNLKVKFNPQEIANQLWALAKLVEREVLTPKQTNPSVTALLPQVQHHQAVFKPQEIANQLWALAKLVETEVFTTEQASPAVTGLLPQVQKHQAEFNPQAVANQLWALAKLVEREVHTPEQTSLAVTALLPQVQYHQAEFNPQAVANQLWALAKLVEREILTLKQVSPAVTALLPQVQHHQAKFKPQGTANQLWALAKLVEREVLTLKQVSPAVTALLPLVQYHQSDFTPQHVANQLWALAKLVERDVLTLKQASPAVTALLALVQYHQAEFKPQEIANQLWALAKLVECETLMLEQADPAVTALLPQVQNHQAVFTPRQIANQLWALAVFGDWVMLDTISNILGMLDIDALENLQSQQMALWALTVFLARGLDQAAVKPSMMKLYRTLKDEEKKDSSEKRATILRLSGVWLEENLQDLPIPDYKSVVSRSQTKQHRILSHEFPDRMLETEASIDGLPPVDLLFSREKVVIEIQGPHHYLDKEKQFRTGSTTLKITTYQKLGYKVIEVHASDVAKPEIQEELREELSIHFSKTEDDPVHNSYDSSDYDTTKEDEEEWFSAEDQ